MRLFLVSIFSVFIFFICLLTVKFWGQGQTYSEYHHPFYQQSPSVIEFYRPDFAHLQEAFNSNKNLYLDVAITFDQKLVVPKRKWVSTEKPLRLFDYQDVKKDVILITEIKDSLKNKKIIFNISENAQAIHETFAYTMKLIGFEKGENFVVTSQYEAPLKSLKEIEPAWIYGSTQPEILKIVAMQSMYLIEAVNIRADILIHPLKIQKQNFFNEELLIELKKRHKKIIAGPLGAEELSSALELKPFGVILNY